MNVVMDTEQMTIHTVARFRSFVSGKETGNALFE
jgi:hypothetical protein